MQKSASAPLAEGRLLVPARRSRSCDRITYRARTSCTFGIAGAMLHVVVTNCCGRYVVTWVLLSSLDTGFCVRVSREAAATRAGDIQDRSEPQFPSEGLTGHSESRGIAVGRAGYAVR